MIQKRDIVRVGGELVKVGGQIANADTTDWRKLVAYFVAVQDVKDSSRGLYARTLSQYFNWLESTVPSPPPKPRTSVICRIYFLIISIE